MSVSSTLPSRWSCRFPSCGFGLAVALIILGVRVLLLALVHRWHRLASARLTTKGLEQVVLDIGLVGAPRRLSLFHGHVHAQLLDQMRRSASTGLVINHISSPPLSLLPLAFGSDLGQVIILPFQPYSLKHRHHPVLARAAARRELCNICLELGNETLH